MKKLVSIMLIILLMFNFIFYNNVYAKDADGPKTKASDVYTKDPANVSDTGAAEILEQGEVSQKQDSSKKVSTSSNSYGASIVGTVTGILARLINIIVLQIDLVMSQITYGTENDGLQYWFTIERTVFNRVALFNINYFNTYEDEGSYSVGDLDINYNHSNAEVKKSIATVFYICRFIAMTLGLVVLIYIGIRMAISSVASDQAKYKKMLISWVESIIIMFLLPYIISFMIRFGEILTNIFYSVEQSLLDGEKVFEGTIRTQTLNCTINTSGLQLTFWSIVYWCLLMMEIKFLWTYIKRFLMVGFLIAISPLITITYSIDKAGDGRAQAFSNWMQEFAINVFIQPLHAIIYLVFVLTANSIAESSPLVTIAFLLAMGTVEKMVKVIFDMKGLSIKNLGEAKMFKKGK